jgi:hypothetical protein
VLHRAKRLALSEIDKLREAKVSFLDGVRRQTLLRLLLLEWSGAFHVHERLALPPVEYLRFLFEFRFYSSFPENPPRNSNIFQKSVVQSYISFVLLETDPTISN